MTKTFMEILREVLVDLPDFDVKSGGARLRKQHNEVNGKMVHTLDVNNGREWWEISDIVDIPKKHD